MNKLLQILKITTIKSPSLWTTLQEQCASWGGGKRMGLLLLILAISTTLFAQTGQSNFINYQGVASNSTGEVMADETITVGIMLRYATSGAAEYVENHAVTTDANGVFSLKIGNGTATISTYANYQWGRGIATFVTVSINGTEIGTTELLAVPYALSSGDNQWMVEGDDIENLNAGTVKVSSNLDVGGNIKLQLGPAANEISIDGSLAGNNDKAIPTEKAVKTYVDANGATGLEKITQDGKTGWRLIGVDPLYYGSIGADAIDLSITHEEPGPKGGATGTHSVALGAETTASGKSSIAMGIRTVASGLSSAAIGNGTIASGSGSMAMGSGSRAFGHVSIAIGLETDSYGEGSTSMGNKTIALGNSSTAMGYDTHASGNYATSMGDETTASGGSSTSMGKMTAASGENSTAMGDATSASGENSTSLGKNTKAQSYNSLAIGRNNIGGGSADSWVLSDPLFEIGNSESGSRNALTVLKNGKVGIGRHQPSSLLEVAHQDGIPTSANRTNAFSIRNLGTGRSWQLYTHSTGYLELYNDGSHKGSFNPTSGAYAVTSDRKVKKDIVELNNGTLIKVLQLRPVSYLFIDQKDNKRNLGLISQEVKEIFPTLTHYVKEQDLLTLSYTELIPILIKAMQEQQQIIDGQNTKIESLSAELSTIKKDLTTILTRIIAMEKGKIATN